MKINYSNQKIITSKKSIFLAGPTPRSKEVNTWRKDALKILDKLEFDGLVYVPELEIDTREFNYDYQVCWERKALQNSTVIVFWIPRNLRTLPGLTTNIEFGYWICKDSKKVIYGRPDDSERNEYLDWFYKIETGREPINNLNDLLKNAILIANK